jgi:hypothetical protein
MRDAEPAEIVWPCTRRTASLAAAAPIPRAERGGRSSIGLCEFHHARHRVVRLRKIQALSRHCLHLQMY